MRTEAELERDDWERLSVWLSPVHACLEGGTNQDFCEAEVRRIRSRPGREAEIGSDGKGNIAVFVR